MLAMPNATMQLKTTFTQQFHMLEQCFSTKLERINEWFKKQWALTPPPVYGSVDLRNAGFKVAPIDMNLFPAGFNNLNPHFLSLSVDAALNSIQQVSPQAKRILIIPEGHTRNLFYWANVKTLQHILEGAGFSIRLGNLPNENDLPQEIVLTSGETIVVEPVIRQGNTLMTKDFQPDLILLNNDLSEGIPDILKNLEQAVMPPATLGWSHRLKSTHFQHYATVAQEFAEYIGIDPWLISPLFRHCTKIDFMQQDGLDCLVNHVGTLFKEIQQKYDEYRLPYQPFVIVKADAGTYGMAVMTVRNVDELKSLNRKQRTRMSFTKGSQPVNKVIIQEGVYTFEGTEDSVSEPVVYLWGECAVGGFYRVHRERGQDENLNAPGMHFEPIAFTQTCHEAPHANMAEKHHNRFCVYGIIAQLSMLAAAREIKDQLK